MDDLVAQFMSITSCEAPQARQYLEANDNNLEQAINLFFATNDGHAPPQEQDVRDPLSMFDDQIIDEEAQIMNEIVRKTRKEQLKSRPTNVFNQTRDLSSMEGRNFSRHERKLMALFRPPFDIITDLSLQEAREVAQQSQKMVMVNCQDGDDFRCSCLNRDVFSSKPLKELISSNFVFLQYDINDPDGEEYRSLYPFTSFPHIAIIDAFTGEQLRTFGMVKVDTFMEDIVEFVSKEEGDLEEEEEVQEEEVKVPDSLPTEPTGPQTTRIQLRHSGGRLVRNFNLDDTVEKIFEVARFTLKNANVQLTSERRDLRALRLETVEAAGLKNSTVLVELE